MAWFGLIVGFLMIVLGLGFRFFNKPKKQKKLKNERDNYSSRPKHDDYRREILKRNQSYNKITNNNNSVNFEDQEIKRYKKNQNDLKKINTELEELISELSSREKILKNKIRDLNNEILSGSKMNFNQSLKQANKKGDNLPLKYLDAIEMYDDGISLNEIAERLEMGIRETELIIKMYGRGKENNG